MQMLEMDYGQWWNDQRKRRRFRKYILSVGNSVDLNQAFKDFTGRTPDIKPLLQNKGFVK